MFVELINILDRIIYLWKLADIEPWGKEPYCHSLRMWMGGTGTHNRARGSRGRFLGKNWFSLLPSNHGAVARCKISQENRASIPKGFREPLRRRNPGHLNPAHVSKLNFNSTSSRTAPLILTQGLEMGAVVGERHKDCHYTNSKRF